MLPKPHKFRIDNRKSFKQTSKSPRFEINIDPACTYRIVGSHVLSAVIRHALTLYLEPSEKINTATPNVHNVISKNTSRFPQ